MELILPDHWHHVAVTDNPANCASRGLFPTELVCRQLWWNGPGWLHKPEALWPAEADVTISELFEGKQDFKEVSLLATTWPALPIENTSSFTHLWCVMAWIFRFLNNCRHRLRSEDPILGPLSTHEILNAEVYWIITV